MTRRGDSSTDPPEITGEAATFEAMTPNNCKPLLIGSANCVAMTSMSWSWVIRLARTHGVPVWQLGRRRLVPAAQLMTAIERAAAMPTRRELERLSEPLVSQREPTVDDEVALLERELRSLMESIAGNSRDWVRDGRSYDWPAFRAEARKEIKARRALETKLGRELDDCEREALRMHLGQSGSRFRPFGELCAALERLGLPLPDGAEKELAAEKARGLRLAKQREAYAEKKRKSEAGLRAKPT